MREMFTDKDFIAGKLAWFLKLLLIAALVVFFAPLFILPFFNHPCADDYICGIHLRELGFWNYQSFIYNNWGGRFTATLTGAVFAKDNFLYGHYYLHSILLLTANFIGTVFLFTTLNRFILKDVLLQRNLLLCSGLFMALNICILPELSTYIFWFSSAVTYQLPVVLLQVQLALWIIVLFSKQPSAKIISYILLPLLVFVINGFNELFIIVQGILLLLLLISRKKLSTVFMIVVWLAVIASALIVLLSPGIQSRTSIIESKGVITGAAAIAYHVTEVLWSIFKNPMTWFAGVLVFIYGNNAREKHSDWLSVRVCVRYKWLAPVAIFTIVVSAVSLAVIGLKGGIIPDRYVNAVVCIAIIPMLLYMFIVGVSLRDVKFIALPLRLKWVLPVLFLVSLFANDYIVTAYKSILSAPLYNAIMNERETALHDASATKTAVINSYDKALKLHIENEYSHSTKTLTDLVQQKPMLLFFQDDLTTDYSINTLKEFYQIDSIEVKR